VTPWLVVQTGWPGTLLRVSTEAVLRLRTVPMAVAWAGLCTVAVGGGALWRLQATRRRATTATRSD
jgi:hypothetical protein